MRVLRIHPPCLVRRSRNVVALALELGTFRHESLCDAHLRFGMIGSTLTLDFLQTLNYIRQYCSIPLSSSRPLMIISECLAREDASGRCFVVVRAS